MTSECGSCTRPMPSTTSCTVTPVSFTCFPHRHLPIPRKTGYDSWQRTGRILNAIIALGWHQEVRSKDLPFFLVEIRKRLVASAFAHDKWLCAFLGRPPRLSYRYCVVQLPLDLTDNQLLSHGPELEAALATLDGEGWSKGTRVQRRTWSRAWVQYCVSFP